MMKDVMAIDNDLVVEIDGSKVFFEPPGLNEWATIVEMDNKSKMEQAKLLGSKALGVEGLKRKDGTDVTLEDLKEGKYPIPFFFQLKKKWLNAVISASNDEVSAKNESTPVSSS